MPKLHACKIDILSSTVFVCVLPSTSVKLVVPRGADCKVISDVMKGVLPELVAETSARALVDEVATNERTQDIIVLGDAVLSGGIAAKAMLEEKMLASIIAKTKIVEILFFFSFFSPFLLNKYFKIPRQIKMSQNNYSIKNIRNKDK